jgi:hypothetical protein
MTKREPELTTCGWAAGCGAIGSIIGLGLGGLVGYECSVLLSGPWSDGHGSHGDFTNIGHLFFTVVAAAVGSVAFAVLGILIVATVHARKRPASGRT